MPPDTQEREVGGAAPFWRTPGRNDAAGYARTGYGFGLVRSSERTETTGKVDPSATTTAS